jgi:hypothetical protein
LFSRMLAARVSLAEVSREVTHEQQ